VLLLEEVLYLILPSGWFVAVAEGYAAGQAGRVGRGIALFDVS
jgi:hypothetical protein